MIADDLGDGAMLSDNAEETLKNTALSVGKRMALMEILLYKPTEEEYGDT